MKELSLLLSKWISFVPPNETIKKTTAKVVSDEIGLEIEPSQVRVGNGVVYLDVDSVVRTEIFMRRKNIEEKLAIFLTGNKREVR